MTYKHTGSVIEETSDRKFLSDEEKNIVDNLYNYSETDVTRTKSTNLVDPFAMNIHDDKIEGKTYQNILNTYKRPDRAMYMTYSTSGAEISVVYHDKDQIRVKNVSNREVFPIWLARDNIMTLLKNSTEYTVIFNYESNKPISSIVVHIGDSAFAVFNTPFSTIQLNKNNGTGSVVIRTNDTFVTNSNSPLLYFRVYIDNMQPNDTLVFSQVQLIEGVLTEDEVKKLGKVTDISGVGSPSRNLFNPNDVIRNPVSITDGSIINELYTAYYCSNYIPVKSGSRYLLYERFTQASRYIIEYDANKAFIKTTHYPRTAGGRYGRLETTPTTKYVIVRFWTDEYMSEFKYNNYVTFREDSHEIALYEPYYEGCRLTLNSNNGNLIDYNDLEHGNMRGCNPLSWEARPINHIVGEVFNNEKFLYFLHTEKLIEVDPSTKYYFSRGIDYMNMGINIEKIMFYDITKRCLGEFSSNGFGDYIFNAPNGEFTTHPSTRYIRIVFKCHADHKIIQPEYIKECQYILSSNKDLTYRDNKRSSVDIMLDYPLMKINNYMDEIRDGFLIRRVGKIVLSGKSSEIWKTIEPVPAFEIDMDDYVQGQRIMNDKFAKAQISAAGFSGCGMSRTQHKAFRIRPENYQTETLQGFKNWLSNNNVTVYYPLENPKVTKLNIGGISTYKEFTNVYVHPNTKFKISNNINSQIINTIDRLDNLSCRIDELEKISLTSVLGVIDLEEVQDEEKS